MILNTSLAKKTELISTFILLLNEQRLGSQIELVEALSLHGFKITQTRVSRLLIKLGAIKIRDHNHNFIYKLPSEHNVPRIKQAIDTVVLAIKHNNAQIIIKTIVGGGRLITKIIESMDETTGVLACIGSDNTILVIPADVAKVEQVYGHVLRYLNISCS
ncbi:MAG: transcriptional regulator of arginine metabolism [Alteromonadaceae bacterium]|jgi:transcriptional regulator of arginine metabolism